MDNNTTWLVAGRWLTATHKYMQIAGQFGKLEPNVYSCLTVIKEYRSSSAVA